MSDNLSNDFNEVLSLQPLYIPDPTSSAMLRRRDLITSIIPERLRFIINQLQLSYDIDDLIVKGSNGQQNAAYIPWARIYSIIQSPKATEGLYLVYLFAADGSSLYLSLNQGTQLAIGRTYQEKPNLEENSIKIRDYLSRLDGFNDSVNRICLIETIDLAVDGIPKTVGKGYQKGNIFAIRYDYNQIPDDSIINNGFKHDDKYFK